MKNSMAVLTFMTSCGIRQTARQVAVLVLLPVCLSAQQLESPIPSVELPSDLASRLIRGAVVSANYFSAEEQADLLLDASNASRNLERDEATKLALQLFSQTWKMSLGHYRAAMQKNALVALAQLDPEKAAELYRYQDDPPQPRLSEDIRAYGTQILFPALWAKSGSKSLDRIEQLSSWLGLTGEYPYAAIAGIIKKLNEKNPDKANELFVEAVSYFGRGPEFAGLNKHYVDFLVSTSSIPQRSDLHAAIQKGLTAIESAQDTAQRAGNKSSMFYQINTPDRTFEIHSQTTYLIYRLTILAGSVDPKWPDQIREHFPALASLPSLAPSDPVTVSAAASSDGKFNGSIPSALGQSLAMQLPDLAQSDPQRAMDQANKIGDPSERAIAIASIVPFLVKVNSSDVQGWLTKLTKIAESLPPGETKLRLLVQLVLDQFSMDRKQDGLKTASHAIDLGSEIFAEGMQANPGKMSYTMPGFDPLMDLSRAMGADAVVRPDALTLLGRTGNDILRARMQIAFAEGISRDSTSLAAGASPPAKKPE